MDASIIAASKRRYRRYHLHNAITEEERGSHNIYKVDQLKAMQWSKAAWDEISSKTIRNSFWHTGLFDLPAEEAPEDSFEHEINNDLANYMQKLAPHNPMSIESLLNLAVAINGT